MKIKIDLQTNKYLNLTMSIHKSPKVVRTLNETNTVRNSTKVPKIMIQKNVIIKNIPIIRSNIVVNIDKTKHKITIQNTINYINKYLTHLNCNISCDNIVIENFKQLKSKDLKKILKFYNINYNIKKNDMIFILNIIKPEKKKCFKLEDEVFNYFKINKKFTIDNKSYNITNIIKNSKKYKKSDIRLILEKNKTVDLQLKLPNYYFVENWINYITRLNQQELIFIKNIYKNDKHLFNNLVKQNKKKLHISNLVVFVVNKKTDYEITDPIIKKKYIMGNCDGDYFYYGISKLNHFTINDLVLVTDTYINNIKLYYKIRPIYRDTSKTNNRIANNLGTFKEKEDLIYKLNLVWN